MPNYLLVYRAPKGYQPQREGVADTWGAWFQSISANLLDLGNPALVRGVLGENKSTTDLGGYSLLEAEDLTAALELARGCPFLTEDGAVEVGELTMLNPDSLRTTVADHAGTSRR